MPDKILVTYASRTGFTVGVAEAIGKILADSGAQVEVRPMSNVSDLSPYRAVVAGSAIQGQRWLPEALGFLRANRATLEQKRVATFLVCMMLAMKNENCRRVLPEWMQPVHALITPVSEGLFAGAPDIKKVPSLRKRLMFRLSVLFGVWTEGEHRDWDAIRAWATNLVPLL
jgi:menaquinone-dependent protoporphyrinogen oxidase